MMRRKDREVKEFEEILGIIDGCDVLRIGLSVENQAYIVPMNFGYYLDGDKLIFYMHCARKGKKIDWLAINNRVCFEMDRGHTLITDEIACEWSMNFESVMGEGKLYLVEDLEEKKLAFKELMRHYGAQGSLLEHFEMPLERVGVLRLEVDNIVCKRKQ